MQALYYSAVIEIIAYLAITCAKFGVPKSISDSHYLWKGKGYDYLFTFVMWSVGIPILIYWVSLSPDNYKFLPFLSISGMCFVGAACAFKETLTSTVHYASAGVWASTAVLFFCLMHDWLSLALGIVTFIVMALFIGRKHFIFWAEVSCIVTMVFGIARL